MTLPPTFSIRRAVPAEVGELTELCRAAKAHWGHPPEWIEAWADSLRITSGTLAREEVFVAVRVEDAVRVGFFGLRRDGDLWWLEHFWIAPAHMGQGSGRELFRAAVAIARKLGVRRLEIKSDPNAEGFYLRMGARRVGEERYLLLGKHPRELPLLVFEVVAAG